MGAAVVGGLQGMVSTKPARYGGGSGDLRMNLADVVGSAIAVLSGLSGAWLWRRAGKSKSGLHRVQGLKAEAWAALEPIGSAAESVPVLSTLKAPSLTDEASTANQLFWRPRLW
jgi:hypothetical protein